MVNIRDLLITLGAKRRRGKKLLKKTGVTIHNVGNHGKKADADANARYYNNSKNESSTGVHFFVDEKEIVRIVPQDEIVEHTGKRLGNDTTVCIEICDNSDGDILKATNNAVELAAKVLKEQGHSKAVWKTNIFQHNDWNGKDCPEDIRRGKPYNWATFVNKVNDILQGSASTPISYDYVTNKTAPIYSYSRTISAGHKLKLECYTGGKYADVINEENNNSKFIVEFDKLVNAGGGYYKTLSGTRVYKVSATLAKGVKYKLESFTGGKYADVKDVRNGKDYIVAINDIILQ